MKRIIIAFISVCLLVFLQCSQLVNNEAVYPESPQAVRLYEPDNIYGSAMEFVWSKYGGDNFGSYELYYDTNPDITQESILATSKTIIDDTTIVLGGLDDDVKYYARVFVRNSASFSASNEISVSTEKCECGEFKNKSDRSMRLLPPGCFKGKDSSIASISHGYYIDTTEITIKEWNRVLLNIDLDIPGVTFEHWELIFSIDTVTSIKPINFISWQLMLLFCNERSKQDGYDTCYTYSSLLVDTATYNFNSIVDLDCDFFANGYRLPTEDEWEYAYRAGEENEYFWGKDGETSMEYPFEAIFPETKSDSNEISEYAWWKDNDDPRGVKEAAQKKPNSWGIYDMSGNVQEACWDLKSAIRPKSRLDYAGLKEGPKTSDVRIVRGGYYKSKPPVLTAWWRMDHAFPDGEKEYLGFRTVRLK